MREINWIVVHCSATPNGKPFFAKDIDAWHKQQGWSGIGYHWVIDLDGTLEKGRPIELIGAHVEGHNSNSVGICLIGNDEFTQEQFDRLRETIITLLASFPNAKVCGHRDFAGVHKTCPNFDVKEWLKDNDIHINGGK